jgi:hypothetical protein
MKRRGVALLAVLVLAAVLRFAGIGFGLPFELRPDEEVFRHALARMAETGDLNPHRFEYGGALFHALYGVVRGVHAIVRLVDPSAAGTFEDFAKRPSAVIPIQRSLSALLGVATILLAWMAGRRLGGTAGGLTAAALLAVLFLPVRDAHFGTVDVPAAFASMAALVAILRAIDSGTKGAFVLAGALAGVATGIRYVPVVLALPLWFAAWRADRASGRGALKAAFGPRVLLAAASMIAGALLSAPYCVLAFDEFRSGFQGAFFVGGQSHFEPLARLGDVALVGMPRAADWPFTAAAAVALIVALFGLDPAARAVALFVAAYAAALVVGTNFYLRWLNPVIPPACALIAGLFARVTRSWKHGAAACVALTAAAGAFPAFRSVAIDRLFLRETTFEQAADFARERIPGAAAVSCPSPGIARVLGQVRLAPWDPHALAAFPEWWAIVPRHPLSRHPFANVGRDPAWVSAVLRGETRVESVARFPAIDAAHWEDVEFEDADFFFYPLRGYAWVERAGPEIEVLRVFPRPRDPATSGPPPPVVSVVVRRDSIRVEFGAPYGVDVLGYYVRFAPEPAAASGAFLGPFPCGREPFDLPLTRAIRGRYVLQAATVAPDGLGPWSASALVVID